MEDYERILTSAEVWAVIKAKHGEDLMVFNSYSAPDGDEFNGPNQGQIETSYGFLDAKYPLLETKTTWGFRPEDHSRVDEKHEYWLCYAIEEGE